MGLAFLLFVWGYTLASPIIYWAGAADVRGSLGVGEGRVWIWGRVMDPAHSFPPSRTGFGVDKLEEIFGIPEGGFAPALEIETNIFGARIWRVKIGHWVLVMGYTMLWLGTLLLWQQRKRRLAGPVEGRVGKKRIAIPVMGIVVMAVALVMKRQEEKLPDTWKYAFRGSARETWNLLNEDGVVTAEEIIELCYKQKVPSDNGSRAAQALLGHSADPIPVLRRMMGEPEPTRRTFALLIAGNLGDVRLRPDLEKLQTDRAPAGLYHFLWSWNTVGGGARDALGRLERGGILSSLPNPESRESFAPWLQRAKTTE